MKILQTWIHKGYPYIQKVYMNPNEFQLVSDLNQALSNPNLELLKLEIYEIEQLLNIAKSKNSHLSEIESHWAFNITVSFSNHIIDDLQNQLNYLQDLLLELRSPQKIDILDLREYYNQRGTLSANYKASTRKKPKIKKRQVFLGFSNKQFQETPSNFIFPSKKMDPYEIVPNPFEIKDLISDKNFSPFKDCHCQNWIIADSNFELTKNRLPKKSKIALEANLKNDGQAGLFELYSVYNDKIFIGEDINVYEALKQIVYFVFSVYKDCGMALDYENPKYKNH